LALTKPDRKKQLYEITTLPAKNYFFNGSDRLAANRSLVKSSSGSLTFSNNAPNRFSSLVAISNRAVTFANNSQNTFGSGLNIHGGSVTFAGPSANVIVNPGLGNPTVIASGASLSVNNANANSFGGAPISLDGTLSFNQAADSTLDGEPAHRTLAPPLRLVLADTVALRKIQIPDEPEELLRGR